MILPMKHKVEYVVFIDCGLGPLVRFDDKVFSNKDDAIAEKKKIERLFKRRIEEKEPKVKIGEQIIIPWRILQNNMDGIDQ